MTSEHDGLPRAIRVPHTDCLVGRSRGHATGVAAHNHVEDLIVMTREHEDPPLVVGVP